MIDNNFKIVRKIGHGCSSSVYLVKDGYNRTAAVKAIRNDKDYDDLVSAELLKREFKLLNHVHHHPNIINPYYTKLNGEISYDNKIEKIAYNVLEFAENGSIANFIMFTGSIEENIWRFFMMQICDAIKFIHDQNIAHLDIKLENILLDQYFNIKVADLGSSVNVVNTKGSSSHRRGTIMYMPPEVQYLKRGNKYNAFAADIYALGMTLYVMLTGEFPSHNENLNEMYTVDTEMTHKNSPKKESKLSDASSHLSNEVMTLIQKMISLNPDNRPTINEVMKDDWFSHNLSHTLMEETYREMEWRRLYMKKNFKKVFG